MSERIVLIDDQAELTNDSGTQKLTLTEFSERLGENTLQGLDPSPLPQNLQWLIRLNQFAVAILQFSPAVWMLRWITADSPRPYGKEVTTSNRRLALPYVIFKIPFVQGKLLPRIELFYRREPLSSLDGPGGELLWPNLLNVSPHAHGCASWFCSQYLLKEKISPGIAIGCEAVAHHCFSGQLNYSSEAHEGASTFSMAQEMKVDERVTDVDRWEQETSRDPLFVLNVSWAPTQLTVRQLIDAELSANGLTAAPSTVGELGNLMLRKRRPK